MQQLNKSMVNPVSRPVTIIQFGEGNFLRAFVDYMVDIANEAGAINMGVAIVKPIPFGSLDLFEKQDNLYTVCLRGLENGERVTKERIVTSVSQVVDPFTDFDAYKKLYLSPEVRFVVSNTTEAGIVFSSDDLLNDGLPKTYPGKLTKLLHERFIHFSGAADKGLIMLPCELIENNGSNLRQCVMQYIRLWKLDDAFRAWVEESCIFCNTLVDRIVTGYPKDEAEEICRGLGYTDSLLACGEPFALWVIASDRPVAPEFPLDKAGLPVVFAEDVTPYRDRKVRILNGAHTSMVPAAFLTGKDYVIECMEDEVIRRFMNGCIFEEIIPTLTLDKADLESFAGAVTERFGNPFIKHALMSIALNSVSKWKSRIAPSLIGYYQRFGKLPVRLTFSLAALLTFYKGEKAADGTLTAVRGGETYSIRDDADVVDFFAEYSSRPTLEQANMYISRYCPAEMAEIPGIAEAVAGYVDDIASSSMEEVLQTIA